ncbi:MAG: hypothetical protein ACE5FY_07840 [Nitrospiria bacterium]
MDKEIRKFLEGKFNAIDEKFEDTKRHTDQKLDETKHYFGMVAEGVANLNEKLDQHIEENEEAHREILSAIKFSYAELDQRIRVLETNFQALKLRLDRLEAGRN